MMGLVDTFRKMVDGLRAVHDFQNFRVLFKVREDQAKLRRWRNCFRTRPHPVVRTHPITRRKCILSIRSSRLGIEGLEPDESRAILEVLFAQVHVPEYQFRVRWNRDSGVLGQSIGAALRGERLLPQPQADGAHRSGRGQAVLTRSAAEVRQSLDSYSNLWNLQRRTIQPALALCSREVKVKGAEIEGLATGWRPEEVYFADGEGSLISVQKGSHRRCKKYMQTHFHPDRLARFGIDRALLDA